MMVSREATFSRFTGSALIYNYQEWHGNGKMQCIMVHSWYIYGTFSHGSLCHWLFGIFTSRLIDECSSLSVQKLCMNTQGRYNSCTRLTDRICAYMFNDSLNNWRIWLVTDRHYLYSPPSSEDRDTPHISREWRDLPSS